MEVLPIPWQCLFRRMPSQFPWLRQSQQVHFYERFLVGTKSLFDLQSLQLVTLEIIKESVRGLYLVSQQLYWVFDTLKIVHLCLGIHNFHRQVSLSKHQTLVALVVHFHVSFLHLLILFLHLHLYIPFCHIPFIHVQVPCYHLHALLFHHVSLELFHFHQKVHHYHCHCYQQKEMKEYNHCHWQCYFHYHYLH